ncbi:DUF87 domain-containing protein [Kribbella sp. NBC_01505]|uniref:ATP-binding protein n=1 Tax=Kribbella sp. NBC_01505 TaxID=2903580 RepID=UPI00386D83B8
MKQSLSHHRDRIQPRPVEVSRNTWIWAATVPWLPDIGLDRDQVETPGSMLGYHALAESIATGAPGGTAVQIRLYSSGSPDGKPGTVRPMVFGRAGTEEASIRLAALVRATVPAELSLIPLDGEELVQALQLVDPSVGPLAATAEIRRRREDIDKLPGAALEPEVQLPAVLRWSPQAEGLRSASSVLSRHATPIVAVLHMEPARPSVEMLDHLDAVVREIAADVDPAGNPMRRQIAAEYLRRLRDLPRAALEVRVLIAAVQRIEPGVAEAVGIALTAQQAYSVVQPRTEQELLLATELIDRLSARWWGSDGDPITDEILRLTDTGEAAAIVRLPVPIRGGSPGLPSVPVSTLPRAAQIEVGRAEPEVFLGHGLGGGEVALTLTELNQHLLVAGLPGFGKTTTVQTMLYRLWTEHRIPFLVLDPAKADYARLTESLGGAAKRIRLSPQSVAFNPFAVPPGCTAHAHAGRVLAAFDSALGLSAQWMAGYITLARGLFAAYERAGTDGTPTLRSFYAELGDMIERSRFAGADGANLRAALLGRLEFLVRGPLGAALTAGPDGGIDWAGLERQPVVVEFRDFSGPTERSLMFALMLAGLISYREANPVRGRLGHVTVLEEAHRVLAGGAATESEGVRLFVEAIAELRGSGEGFVIVDQAPTLLHPGVSKLTGSQLTHRLVDYDERVAVGSALLLDSRQQLDLARLDTGQAVLFSAGRTASVVVDVETEAALDEFDSAVPAIAGSSLCESPSQDLPWCIGCRSMCRHLDHGRALASSIPMSVKRPEKLVLALADSAGDANLLRCAAATALADRHEGSVPDFLSDLRDVDDAIRAEVIRRDGPGR